MNNLIYHRRKLLDFDHPLDQPYIGHIEPRYYSEFYPWYHTKFTTFEGPGCRDKICVPEYKKVVTLEPKYRMITRSGQPTLNTPLIMIVILMLFITLFLKN